MLRSFRLLAAALGLGAALVASTVAAQSTQFTDFAMGTVAFVMAKTINVPDLAIVQAALISATLSFVTVFWMVHLEAGRKGLVGLPSEQCPNPWTALRLMRSPHAADETLCLDAHCRPLTAWLPQTPPPGGVVRLRVCPATGASLTPAPATKTSD